MLKCEKKVLLFVLIGFVILDNTACEDNGEPNYKYINVASIVVDSVALFNIVGKWHLIIKEDTINNNTTVDSNEALVFYKNGDYGIETQGVIQLSENHYCKIAYSSFYYVNKQTNKIDSMLSFIYDDEKDKLGLLYEIPPDKSTFGCTNDVLRHKINYYKKID